MHFHLILENTKLVFVGAIRYIVETTRIDELADEIDLKTDTVEELRYTAENLVPGATYQFVLFSVGTGDVINENGSPPVTKQTGNRK